VYSVRRKCFYVGDFEKVIINYLYENEYFTAELFLLE
jgi:hypothetical protein